MAPLTWPAWPPEWPEIETAILQVIQSGQWGRYHADIKPQLAAQIASKFGVSHVHLCSSGTAAIELALRAGRLAPGDEVLLSAYDFPGNRRTVELLGLRPVLVDCQPACPVVDVEKLIAACESATRAVIVSHLYGWTVDMRRLREWSDAEDILLIEDACHLPGAMINGKPAGTWGHIGAISFGGSKTLTCGNGGALLTDSDLFSQRTTVVTDRPSEAYPLSALQAAAIGPQLARLEEMAAKRSRSASELARLIGRSSSSHWSLIPQPEEATRTDFYKLSFRAPTHEARQQAVQQGAEYGLPLHEGYRSAGRVSPRRCRVPEPTQHADHWGKHVLTLDHNVLLADDSNLERIADCLLRIFEQT